MRTVYTIGYEGMNIASFIEKLQHYKIKHVLDVRQIPLSRKQGFSKRSLAANLAHAGIGYSHYTDLGSPADARTQVRKDKNYTKLFRSCRAAYRSAAAKQAFATMLRESQRQRSALLCFCFDARHCHRAVLSSMLAKSVRIEHL